MMQIYLYTPAHGLQILPRQRVLSTLVLLWSLQPEWRFLYIQSMAALCTALSRQNQH